MAAVLKYLIDVDVLDVRRVAQHPLERGGGFFILLVGTVGEPIVYSVGVYEVRGKLRHTVRRLCLHFARAR